MAAPVVVSQRTSVTLVKCFVVGSGCALPLLLAQKNVISLLLRNEEGEKEETDP